LTREDEDEDPIQSDSGEEEDMRSNQKNGRRETKMKTARFSPTLKTMKASVPTTQDRHELYDRSGTRENADRAQRRKRMIHALAVRANKRPTNNSTTGDCQLALIKETY